MPHSQGKPEMMLPPSARQREAKQTGCRVKQSLFKLCNIQKLRFHVVSVLKGQLITLTLGLFNTLPELLQEKTKPRAQAQPCTDTSRDSSALLMLCSLKSRPRHLKGEGWFGAGLLALGN